MRRQFKASTLPALDPTKIRAPTQPEYMPGWKPGGGFWTSTYHPTFGSAWVRWCLSERFFGNGAVPACCATSETTDWGTHRGHADADDQAVTWRGFLLDVDPDVRVYVIDTYADLERLHDAFPFCVARIGDSPRLLDPTPHLRSGPIARMPWCGVDWLAVAARHDGIHLTDRGQGDTRLTMPLSLYGWDCESTIWFRWAFTRVTPVADLAFPEADWAFDFDAEHEPSDLTKG